MEFVPLSNESMAVGELCIGGAGVARGYLNCNDQIKFLNINSNSRYYRTGDLVRRIKKPLNKSLIQFLGRKDELIKIRGVRIDPIEIQNLINKILCQIIKDICSIIVFVTSEKTKKSQQTTELVAFITIKIKNIDLPYDSIKSKTKKLMLSSKQLSNEELFDLKNELKKVLPEHFIPVYFISIDEIPKTYNGKIDRKNLSLHFAQWIDEMNHIFQSNELIKLDSTQLKIFEILLNIWQNILSFKIKAQTNNKFIIKNYNFFELGGHSLLLFKLKQEISNEFSVNLIYFLKLSFLN